MAASRPASVSLPPLWTRDLLLLALGVLLQAITFNMLMPVLPLFVTDVLGGQPGAVGLAVGAYSATALLTRPFAGYLLDRFGRRTPQLLTTGCFGVITFTYLLAQGLSSLLVVRLLHGAAWGLVSVAGPTIAADLVPPDRRGEGLSLFGLTLPLGMALGPLLGSWALASGRFTRVFLLAGLFAVGSWCCYLVVRHPRVADPTARFRLGRVFDGPVAPVSVFMLLLCVGWGALIAFIPLYLEQAGFAAAAPFFGCYALGAIVSRLFSGRWYDRHGPVPPIGLGMALLAGGWVLLAASPGRPLVLLAGLSLGLGFGVAIPAFTALAMDLVPPARRGAANATAFTSYDLGTILGAVGAGPVVARWGLAAVFALAAVGVGVALSLFVGVALPAYRTHRLRLVGEGRRPVAEGLALVEQGRSS